MSVISSTKPFIADTNGTKLARWLIGLPVRVRRISFALAVSAMALALTALMAAALGANGITGAELAVLSLYVLTLPWIVIAFWNAAIGLALMRGLRDPAAAVCPIAEPPHDTAPIGRTALLSCLRNEATEQVERNLTAMLHSLVRAGAATKFKLFILSDSSEPSIIAKEEEMVARLQMRFRGEIAILYRRRAINTAFKAGNIHDFCERWGDGFDYALVLDADSYMTGERILSMVVAMDANPKLGLLQSLVVGLPTMSAYARIFQFGMRLGMRSYTIGSTWWQADCGPYWGHNAVFRLAPFKMHCHLPELPGRGPLSGPILSHDQVEATFMRRAGYEVRVMPREGGSFEENPPHLLEFIRRDLRWCQGNLQYLRLLRMPGLRTTSRVQLLLAILMYCSAPAWMAFMGLGIMAAILAPGSIHFHPGLGLTIMITMFFVIFAPKLATAVDALCDAPTRASYGGAGRIVAGLAGETLFSLILSPIIAIAQTLFVGGLAFGRAIGWGAQARGVERLPAALATYKLWPQLLIGSAILAWTIPYGAFMIALMAPLFVGLIGAIPFAVTTSAPRMGKAALLSGIWRIPEETVVPPELSEIALPALVEHPARSDRPAVIGQEARA